MYKYMILVTKIKALILKNYRLVQPNRQPPISNSEFNKVGEPSRLIQTLIESKGN